MDALAQQTLLDGLAKLGLDDYANSISEYVELLQRWNRTYNLVARADDITLVNRHVLDSLAVRPFITQGPCVDIGTGAGLPGLLLAVTMPDTEWTLLDANGKKTRFCEQAVAELGLKNVLVVQQRLEQFQPGACYMTIISRAYAQADSFVSASRHLLCDRGRILAMKGKIDREEKAIAAATGFLLRTETLQAPGQTGERHLMIFGDS